MEGKGNEKGESKVEVLLVPLKSISKTEKGIKVHGLSIQWEP